MTPPRSARWSLVAAAVVTAGLTACGSSGHGDNPVVSPPDSTSSVPTSVSTAPSSTPPVDSSSPGPSSSPETSPSSPPTSPSSSPPPTSSSPVTSSPPPSTTTSAPSGPAACTAAQLTISLVRGGAFQHRQLAGLIFANTTGPACVLTGFPSAQLVRAGKLLGRAATPEGSAGPSLTLPKGVSAQSQLTATTDCNAPLSDHVRVRAPGVAASVDLVDTLRACTLTVGALEHS